MTDNNKDWVSIQHIQNLVTKAQRVGLETSELFSLMGIKEQQLANTEATIPVSALEFLLEHMSEQFPEVPLGLMLASDSQPANFGVLGYLSQSSGSFSEVLNTLSKYNGLLSNIGETRIVYEPGSVRIQWHCHSDSLLFARHASEYIIASLVLLTRGFLVRQEAQQDTVVRAVHFPHARPKKISMLSQYHGFFQCPVYFDKATAEIIMDAKVLSYPLRYSDASMRRVLESHADALMAKRSVNHSLSVDVKNLLASMLGEHLPNKEMLAQQLGFSGRSLHRKLEQEQQSFQGLLDEVRLDLACEKLAQSTLSLEMIASDLSFQSRQSFIRWFKSQKHITPGEYRQKNSKGEGSHDNHVEE